LGHLRGSGHDETVVVYTSDHCDNLDTRTFWGKSNMYEESVGVPLIMRGPGVPVGRRVATPVSLVDAHPTITEAMGKSEVVEERNLRGYFATTSAQR
jgi:choline-sulfatase